MRSSESGIETNGHRGISANTRPGRINCRISIARQDYVHLGKAGIRAGEFWIARDCFVEVEECLLNTRGRALVQEEPTFQIVVVGDGIISWPRGDCSRFMRQESNVERAS